MENWCWADLTERMYLVIIAIACSEYIQNDNMFVRRNAEKCYRITEFVNLLMQSDSRRVKAFVLEFVPNHVG